jgi:hypothetical protein
MPAHLINNYTKNDQLQLPSYKIFSENELGSFTSIQPLGRI